MKLIFLTVLIPLIFGCFSINSEVSIEKKTGCKNLICYLDMMQTVLSDTMNCEREFKAIMVDGAWMDRIVYFHNDSINIVVEYLQEDGGEYTQSKSYFYWNKAQNIIIEMRRYKDLCKSTTEQELYLIKYFDQYLRIVVDCDINITQVNNGKKIDNMDIKHLRSNLSRYISEFKIGG